MFSIVASLYKSDRYLPDFTQSLNKFAYDLKTQGIIFELITIINDPTENEKRFLKELESEPWFESVCVKREALYASWNRGVSLAKYPYVGFWNVDDTRFALGLVEAKKIFEDGACLVHFPFYVKRYLKLGKWQLPLPAQLIDKQIPVFSQKTKQQFLEGMVCGPFFMFAKSLYEKAGPFDEQFKIAGDFDWCVRAAKETSKIIKAKCVGGIFRVDGGGLSSGGSERHTVENNVIFKRNNLLEKLIPLKSPLESEYNYKEIFFKGSNKTLLPPI